MVSSPFVSPLFLFGGNTLQEVNCFPPPAKPSKRKGKEKKEERLEAEVEAELRTGEGLLRGEDGCSNSENSLKSLELEKGSCN